MKVYLDNNIYVEIEENAYSLENLKNKNGVVYFYSRFLIDELIEREHLARLNLKNRIDLINILCGYNYLIDTPNYSIECKQKSPVEIYQEEKQYISVLLSSKIKNHISNRNIDSKNLMRELSLKKLEMNNIIASEILDVVNNAIKKSMNKMTLKQYLDMSEAEGRGIFVTLFNLLDDVCYWKDKKGKQISLMYDASHAYCAQYCDYFITNDKRLHYKAEAVYSYLGIKTKVITMEEFIKF